MSRLHGNTLLALVTVVGALALLVVAPAGGVIGGTYDGTDHPFVGSLVVTLPNGIQAAGCTGTLIAPTVFETAGHCIANAASFGIGPEPSDFAAVFDPDISYDDSGHIPNAIPAVAVVLDPQFGFRAGNGWANPHDMAVLILDHAPPGIEPARVPDVGEFDHISHNATFTVVGRGASEIGSRPCPLYAPMACGTRYTTTLRFASLQPFWVRASFYPDLRDKGRLANGDSGSPFFLDGGDGRTIVAAYTGGRSPADQYAYRLDTQAAHDFLDPFLN